MMSTSSRPDPREQFVQQFTYPALDPKAGPGSSKAPLLVVNGDAEEVKEAVKTIPEEEAQTREAAAYGRGLVEGQQRSRAEAERLLAQAKTAISGALEEFGREREVYFQDIEAG